MQDYLKRLIPHAGILTVVMALYGYGLLDRFEFMLMDARFALTERPASNKLVVVEIDERSLRLLDVWPWPRRYHADVVNALLDGGAETIALDIDFSSRATPDDDAALEAALERGGGRITLPVFKQYSGLERDQNSLAETGPMNRFARHVRLGSVVARPDGDSLVRRAGTRLPWGGELIPSFPVLLAERSSPYPSYYVDYGIKIDSIPSISFVDVLRGEIPPGMFAGRNVLVGATAVELGDQLAVPRYYNIPGPYFLAMAANTLLLDRAIQRTGFWPTLAVGLLLTVLLGPRFRGWNWAVGLGVVVGCVGLFFGISLGLQSALPVSLDIAVWLLVPLLSYGQSLVAVIDLQALRIFRQRMAMLHRSAMMRRIVESSFDAVITIDHRGRIDLFNPAAARMFGLDAADAVGKSPDFLFRLQHPEHGQPVALSDLLEGDVQSVEGEGLRRDGTEFATELSIRWTMLGISRHKLEQREEARSFHVITARDVTARREVEEARQRAVEEASSANRAKSEFLAAVSHELRTPLNAVIGFSEMIKDEMLGKIGNEQYLTYAADIHRSGSHLLNIINDILDISRIEAGNRELIEEEISLNELIDSTIRLVQGRSDVKNRVLLAEVPDDLPYVLADERAIKQILINLLTNAVKFSGDDATITAAARVSASGGIEMSIADTGIGIPADVIERITEPFYQVDSSLSRKFEGTGLGLPLVNSLVELHGGRLHIQSAIGEGTTVRCRFPAARTIKRQRPAAE